MNAIKIGIVSDLHTELWSKDAFRIIGGKVRDTLHEADLILLAGDIGNAEQAIHNARRLFKQPLCMVAGNHEFYGHKIEDALGRMRQAAEKTGVHFLDRDTFIGDGVRVLGTTLWTDYDLFATPHLSKVYCQRNLSDFSTIKGGVAPDDFKARHDRDRAWLLGELDKPFDGSTIVMTHHAPVSFAVHPNFEGDALNPAFASRMEHLLVRDDVDMVVFGHTHYSMDRTIDTTRFVSNQVGYTQVLTDLYGTKRIQSETGNFGQIVEVLVP